MSYKIRQLFIKDKSDAYREFAKIGATAPGAKIMSDKFVNIAIKINNVDNKAANILKQEMLARDGDVVTSRDTLDSPHEKSDVIIFGTIKNVRSLAEKIRIQPFGLKALSHELEDFLDNLEKFQKENSLKIGTKNFNLKKEVAIMGILNVTPDSFFDGGKYFNLKKAYARTDEIVSEGAHIIDVGGMSTRPGSQPVSVAEEIERVIPAISYIKKNHDILISIDSYRSEVVREALKAGADIINDISGLVLDDNMKKVAADSKAGLVLMHMKGTPLDMQENPVYDDVIQEIYDFFKVQTDMAVKNGIRPENIIIDPGLGFGKNLEDNFIIIKKLADFKSLGYPILIGASRKSFTGALSGLLPQERLENSIAVAVMCVLNGANLIRVHDVKETVRAMNLVKAIQNA
ncbi:MAG: dihydropteroate synthase [Actinobacteria bacterium]|nr:dihydropteroate synthase [Actinomycetota bacterium]